MPEQRRAAGSRAQEVGARRYDHVVFSILVILFLALPFTELYVLMQVGHALGVLDTIAVMVIISLVGVALARHEGLFVFRKIQECSAAGNVPADEVLDGAIVLAGGLLLVTPGFVTDGVGILLLFPPSRAAVRSYLRRRLRVRLEVPRRGRY